MRFLRHELSRSLVTHWKSNLMLLLEMALCVLVVFVLLYNVSVAAANANWYKTTVSDVNRYQLYLAEEPSESTDQILRSEGEAILQTIKKNSSWRFYQWLRTGFGVPINEDGSYQLPAIFESGYEDGIHIEANDELGLQALKCAYFTPEVFDVYELTVSEGNLFSQADYTYHQGQPYPVILGSEYQEFFDVGDIIDGTLYLEHDQLVVIGFLHSGSFIASPGVSTLVPLDRYIIFPYFDETVLADGTIQHDPLGKTVGAFLWEGTLVVTDPTIDVQKEMNRITNTYGFPAIQCAQYTGSSIKSAEIISQRNVALLSALALVIISLSILSIGMLLNRRTRIDLQTYGMYLISGILPGRIYLVKAAELLIFAALSILPSVWLSYLQFQRLVVPPWQLLCISVPILFVSALPAQKLISRVNLDQIIRRKSQ